MTNIINKNDFNGESWEEISEFVLAAIVNWEEHGADHEKLLKVSKILLQKKLDSIKNIVPFGLYDDHKLDYGVMSTKEISWTTQMK
jgi:hypothetical protein